MKDFRIPSQLKAGPGRSASALIVALLLAVTVMPQAARAADPAEGDRFERLIKVETSGGVVVSESAQASQAGIEILDKGGNAVDAAIATTFAIGVTRPDNCGLGGAGHLLYRGADGTTAALDFRETAPKKMDQNTFNMAYGSEDGATNELRPGVHNVDEGSGHMVVGVPGVVAGMDEALNVLGSGHFDLGDLIAPAERLADEGIKVTLGLQANFSLYQAKFANYPESARLYGGGMIHGPFAYVPIGLEDPAPLFEQDEYARSLALIATFGRDAFYKEGQYDDFSYGDTDYPGGESIAGLIVDDMANAAGEAQQNPVLLGKTGGTPNDIGLITADDLASYEPIWKTPLVGHYRDHQVIAMPPPASGMTVIEILNLLENFKLSSFGRSSADHLHALAETQKLAWADRLEYLADPDFVTVPTDRLISKRYAQQRDVEIDMARAKNIQEYADRRDLVSSSEGTDTTHFSVIDGEGNAVAVTCSLNSPFGSGVIAQGTGFLLNNELGDFDWTWDIDRATPANAPTGGKRPRSAQSPTIVVKGGRPVLVTGGAGAQSIVLGVVQNIVSVVDFGLDVFHAIDVPRIEAANARVWWFASDGSENEDNCASESLDQSYLALEHNRIADTVETELEDLVETELEEGRGHILCRVDIKDGYVNIPRIQSAGTDLSTGKRLAVSDPRGLLLDVFGVDEFDYYDDQGPMGQGGVED